MIGRILLAAIAAGFVAGIFVSGVQMLRVTPLIIAAEAFESGGTQEAHSHDHSTTDAAKVEADGHSHDHGGEAWMPDDGIERTAYTVLSNVLTGAGFALLLAAAITVRGREVDWRRGAIWGAGGYLAFSLMPAFGLPPELPGMYAADLVDRQIWWLATAAATIVGLVLIVFSDKLPLALAGAAILIAPHFVGAPHPEGFGGGVPAEMVAQFVAASLVTTCLFWLVLGALTGHLLGRANAAA